MAYRKREDPTKRDQIRHGLKSGKLPAECKYIENRLNAFRRQVEEIVVQIKGEITLTDAAYIQTALRWERHSALCLRYLTKNEKTLRPIEWLSFNRDIAAASEKRDKAIAALKLDRDAKDDILEALYGQLTKRIAKEPNQ